MSLEQISNSDLKSFMDFAAWVDRVIFPDDLASDLHELGVSLEDSVTLKIEFRYSNKNGKFNFVRLYQSYSVNAKDDCDWAQAFNKWVENMWSKYVEIQNSKG